MLSTFKPNAVQQAGSALPCAATACDRLFGRAVRPRQARREHLIGHDPDPRPAMPVFGLLA
jgi:hypothetical protein